MISRREFVRDLAVAGAASVIGSSSPGAIAAEPPLETRKIRLISIRGTICYAPFYIAEELLKAEGFTDIEYVTAEGATDAENRLAAGTGDLHPGFSGRLLIRVDAGNPIVILSGLHTGCYELFGTDQIRSIRDLKGKRVAVTDLGSGRHVFLSIMAARVGLDPHKDINWVTDPPAKSIQLFAEGKVDAFMTFPPEPQELRAKNIGHVIVNTTTDRPWSQYFCCMIAGNREFVQKHPVAAKRALRAILKANNMCALEPARTAKFIVDKGYTKNYDYSLQTIQGIPYGQWREYDPEDTIRYYALRMQESGFIKSSPQKIIAQGTDWRILNELKKELKG